jgi:hypothetical protein
MRNVFLAISCVLFTFVGCGNLPDETGGHQDLMARTGSVSTVSGASRTSVVVDTLIRSMTGGETLFDENSGTFAWVNADGTLVAFNSKTATVSQLNGGASAPPYGKVLSVSANQDGTVAWLYQADSVQNGEYRSDFIGMTEKTEIVRTSFVRNNPTLALPASVAASNDDFGFSAPIDESGGRVFDLYSASTGELETGLMPAFSIFGGNALDLRMHGMNIGFLSSTRYVTGDISALDLSVSSMPDTLAVDFNNQSLIWMDWYSGTSYVGTSDRLGTNGYDLDSESRPQPTCTRCVAISWDGRFAAWNAVGGIRYANLKKASGSHGLISGASEFVIDGAMLYYIAPGANGSVGLYGRQLN